MPTAPNASVDTEPGNTAAGSVFPESAAHSIAPSTGVQITTPSLVLPASAAHSLQLTHQIAPQQTPQQPTTERDISLSRTPSPFATRNDRTNLNVDRSVALAQRYVRGENDSRRQQRPPPGGPTRLPITKRRKQKGPLQKGAPGKRGSGFSQGELESLLDLLEEHLPLGKEEWETVCRLHQARYPTQKRNADSIRRKFSALCRTTVPTGDPSIPQDVFRAKRIREQMTERADIGDGAESDDDYTDKMNEDTPPFLPSGAFETETNGAALIPEVPNDSLSVGTPDNIVQRVTPSPRPLVRKRSVTPARKTNEGDSVLEVIQASMMQEQIRREAEHHQRMMDREDEKARREEERRVREEQRAEDRERRDEERRRSDNMMQMMMVALIGRQPRPQDDVEK